MSFVNKALIVGNIGKAPQYKELSGGKGVCTFWVATTEKWHDRVTKEKKHNTEWHHIECFGRLADVVREYANSGAKIYVEGKIKTSNYTDNQGIERRAMKILASEIQLLSKKNEVSQESESNEVGCSSGFNPTSDAPLFNDDDIPF
jgi:single-strand DNA-binding protein